MVLPFIDGVINPGKKKRQEEARKLAKPATKADLDKLRVELKETPEEKEELVIYNKWTSLTKEQQKEKWQYLSIRQRNRLSKIVNERRVMK